MTEDPLRTETTEYEPNRHGRYVFRRPLASGGLGVVSIYYDEQLNREVALKEIRDDCADDSRHQQNFCAEAEVTGLLEHPGVVPIYSMGTSEAGRPYYAMRFITGRELRDDIKQLHKKVRKGVEPFVGPRLRQLIQRLIDVCNVMHYAHSRGVLHRDLKSVNVMLGRYGETLVIDWGLAKATGESEVEPMEGDSKSRSAKRVPKEQPVSISEEHSRHTQVGTAMGTVSYAPPEQLNGQTKLIDARSDIYSLGAILYEILTGEPPQKGLNLTEAIRVITTGEIPPPSEVNRRTPRPLNAIAGKALEPKQDDRYQSAKELSSDLQRWLDDEPVSTYCETPMERLYRWKKRHETFVRLATASLAVVAVVSALAWYRVQESLRQEQIAKQEAQVDRANAERSFAEAESAKNEATKLYHLARDATDNLLMRTSDRLIQIPAATEVRKQLLRDAANSYQAMARERPDDPELRRESIGNSLRLAEVLKDLTEPEEALESLNKSRDSLGDPKTPEDRLLLAQILIEESRLHGNDKIELAKKAIRRAINETEDLLELDDSPAEARLVSGQALIQRGNVAIDESDSPKAIESFTDAADVLRGLLRREPGEELERRARLQLVRAYRNEAYERADQDLKDTKIRTLYESAIGEAKRLSDKDPENPSVIVEHAGLLNNLADHLYRDLEDPQSAAVRYEKSISYFDNLAKQHPDVLEYQEFRTLALTGRGNIASEAKEHDAALEYFRRAVESANQLLKRNENLTSFRAAAASAKAMYANESIADDLDKADALFQEAEELIAETDPDDLRPTIDYGVTQLRVAQCQAAIDQSMSPEQQERFLTLAIERLGRAVQRMPYFWAHASQDDDLELLRQRMPQEFDALNPEAK